MSRHAGAREIAQRAGLDPRYLRRWRWITKARMVRGVGALVPANLACVHTTRALAQTSEELGLDYHEFFERPANRK